MEIIIPLIIIGVVIYFIKESKSSKKNYNNYDYSYQRPIYQKPKINERQIDIDDIKLSEEQQKIFDIIENQNGNIFVTGKAGTGKSSLLQYFKYNSKKRLVVVAPTGVAALNVGGQTIHSLFRILPAFVSKDKLNQIKVYPKTAFLLRNIDTVVIDEISMVRADLMDAVDYILKTARNNSQPFGGVQMVMFGDLYQLPPVVSDSELHKYFAHNHGGYYFFNAHAWTNMPDIHELNNIFRQKDENFKNILNEIRHGSISDKLLNELNQRVNCQIPSDGVITLATTNNSVNGTNSFRLSQLAGKMFSYKAIIEGALDKTVFPTEEILQLKEGAQVMFLKNDREKRWVNGTVGFIESLSENEIRVNIDGIIYPVMQETWNKIRYYYNQQERKIEEEVVSSFTQYPLRLAWAITVHKSQGQTFGTIAVDMGEGAFTHGQTYVALSRCTTLEGLYLKRGILKEDIIIDSDIVKFMSLVKIIKNEI
jgi:GTPase SAR1 family protein